MQKNDFIIYRNGDTTRIGLVLYNNIKGETLKILGTNGKVYWVVTSGCEVIHEAR